MRRGAVRLLAIMGLGLVLVLVPGVLTPIRWVSDRTIMPVGGLFARAGLVTGNFFHLVGQVKDLNSTTARLEQENGQLRQRLSDDAEIRVQNQTLRQQLNFPQATTQPLLPAQVVAYQPDNFRQFLTINRGGRDGLGDGLAVVADGNVLVGTLTQVTEASARVFLAIDPNFRINALDQTGRASGTVSGQLGGGLLMDKIAQSDVVKPGDDIITSGLGGNLPKGLIIGRVVNVNQRDNAVFQTAQIVSPLRFDRLELVFVVKT